MLIPVVTTIYFLWFLFRLIDGFLGDVIRPYLPFPLPGVGFVLTLLLVLLTGVLATNYLGRRLIALGEYVMMRTPVARGIYITLKQVVDALWRQDRSAFKQVALVEYPRKGLYSIGFVTSDAAEEIEDRTGQKLVTLFIPTTPNPTSGLLIMVPREDVIFLDMSVQDGVKLVISGGVVAPRRVTAPGSSGQTEPGFWGKLWG